MRRVFTWAEWDVLRGLFLPIFLLQIFVLGFFGMDSVERFLVSREPVLLELRDSHATSTAQEFLVFLQNFAPVSRATYRTREQQFLAIQSMFPDARFSGTRDMSFRDGLLVSVRTSQGYRSLLGVMMIEPQWQELITPSTLVRIGEQAQKMQSIGTIFRFLRMGFLGVLLALSGVVFLSLLRRACQAFGCGEENGTLLEYLGATPFSVVEPVAYRLGTVAFVGILLSFLMMSFIMVQMRVSTMLLVNILLIEGAVAVFLSVSAAILSRHVLCAPLRHAYSSDY